MEMKIYGMGARNLVVNGKLQTRTVGHVGQFPYVDGVDVLKELIQHVYCDRRLGTFGLAGR